MTSCWKRITNCMRKKKKLTERLQSLENDLTEERRAGRDNERRVSEIERLQSLASRAREEAEDREREVETFQSEREAWERERERLETALRDKEDRSQYEHELMGCTHHINS